MPRPRRSYRGPNNADSADPNAPQRAEQKPAENAASKPGDSQRPAQNNRRREGQRPQNSVQGQGRRRGQRGNRQNQPGERQGEGSGTRNPQNRRNTEVPPYVPGPQDQPTPPDLFPREVSHLREVRGPQDSQNPRQGNGQNQNRRPRRDGQRGGNQRRENNPNQRGENNNNFRRRNAANRNQETAADAARPAGDAPARPDNDAQSRRNNAPANRRENAHRGNSPRRENAPRSEGERAPRRENNLRQGSRHSGVRRETEPRRDNARREHSSYTSFTDIYRPAPSVPIRTDRGIKARSQRGAFSKNWWARRWIEAMERLVDPARLQRGRSYARQGQVLTLQETKNGIEAKVQGSRPQPYRVTIQVTPLTDAQWEQVIDAMAEQALFTAQLLAGEMPGNIEDAFNTAGVSLFPNRSGDLSSDCTCPDWANPCKHVAATHYILGDRFDDDPFLLFRMRGRSQEQILEALRQRRAGEAEAVEEEAPAPQGEPVEPLENLFDRFWEPAESLDSFPLTIKPPTMDMPLLKRLGEPPFLSGESLETLLKPAYDTILRSALLSAYSEDEPYETNGNGEE